METILTFQVPVSHVLVIQTSSADTELTNGLCEFSSKFLWLLRILYQLLCGLHAVIQYG